MPVGDLPALLARGGGWVAEGVDAEEFVEAIRSSLSAYGALANPELVDDFQIASVARGFAQAVRMLEP
ncbi:hypothetical protein CO641_00480 [Lysobacteraceae bacterium NML91-0213]|nr:hypothetical protein CO641_00480 [Xanthomonadaceae bacterium NML91-0213]